MSRLSNKYAFTSAYQMIVNFLESDGVVCNFRSKTYDELATYHGGVGYRKLFTAINDKINLYHDILGCLSGEKRANIYESIPVIDFLNYENTDISSTYLKLNDPNNPIDTRTIVKQPVGDEESALSLIENDNEFTINRAIMGFNTAEHFYNSTGNSGTTMNLQVSPCKGDCAYIYKGILTQKKLDDNDIDLAVMLEDELYNKDIINTKILCYKVIDDNPGTASLSPDNEYKNIESCKERSTSNNDLKHLYDTYSEAIYLNTLTDTSGRYAGFTDNNGVFAEKDDDKIEITVHKNDIVLILPTTTYTPTYPNKLLFFKSYRIEDELTVDAYELTSIFDDGESITFKKQGIDNSAYKDSVAYYHYYDSVTETHKIYEYSISSDKYVDSGAIVSLNGVGTYDETSGMVPVTAKYLGISYNLYVLLFKSYNSDFSASFELTELNTNENLPDYLCNYSIFEKLKKYIHIEREYYAEASGLLNGMYCEPKERNTNGDYSTVTKWKFCNDVDKAAETGASINIGTKYNPGHLLYRGNILQSPLQRTPNDANSTDAYASCKGKASIFYNTLFGTEDGPSAIVKFFNNYMEDPSYWNNKNNNYIKIDSLITKFNYTNKTFSDTECKLLSGDISNKNRKLKYINKFNDGGTISSITDILDYIKSFADRFKRNGNGYNLDLNSSYNNVEATLSTETRKRYWWNSNTVRGMERDYSIDSLLENKREIAFTCAYTRVYKKNSSSIDRYKDISIKALSPMALFSINGESPNTILIYPEYANSYPEIMILMTKAGGLTSAEIEKIKQEEAQSEGKKKSEVKETDKNDIIDTNLKTGGIVTFLNNGKILTMSVEKKYDFSSKNLKDFTIRYSGDVVTGGASSSMISSPCYVYILKPLKIQLQDSIKLYDQNDQLIDLNKLSDNSIIGASYPDDYFKVITKYKNGVPIYTLNNVEDINSLKNSIIIADVPSFKNKSDLQNLKSRFSSIQRSFLDSLYNFINNSFTIKKIASSLIFGLLKDWRISDSSTHPLALKEAKSFIENLESFSKLVPSIVNSNFVIDVNDEEVTITQKDFEKLLARIEDTGTNPYEFYYYKVSDKIKNVWDQSYIRSNYPTQSVGEIIQDWLNSLGDDLITKSSSTDFYRKSFNQIKKILSDFFINGEVTKEDCIALDEVFGDNTEPFVTISENYSGKNVSSLFTSASVALYDALYNITYNACVTRPEYSTKYDDKIVIKEIEKYYSLKNNNVRNFDIEPVDSKASGYKLTIKMPTVEWRNFNTVILSPSENNPYVYPSNDGKIPSLNENSLVNLEVLEGLVDFIQTSLEGTNPNDQDKETKFVTCLSDDNPTGRENSLYFRRYNILNSRMNRLNGPLYQAGVFLKNAEFFKKADDLDTTNLNVYREAMTVMPIAEMEAMTYLPTQVATATTIPLDGKFYSDKEMEALRTQIGSSCVLTCTVCKIKDSCPFYDQEEVIKLYCTGLKSIDFWVKDNELELLDKDSFKLDLLNTGDGFDMSEFNRKHLPYSDIMRSISNSQEITEFNLNELDVVRNKLKSSSESSSINLNYDKYVQDDLGWLLGGRYGTVEKNSIKDLENDTFSNVRDALHDYKYLYNAVFIDYEGKDSNEDNSIPVIENDSYIDYRISSHDYDINFEVGPPGHKTKYTGTTKIKIPQNLKLFKGCNVNDDVYIVSDDTLDNEGLEIVPVIYLGTVGNIQLAFDLSDDGIPCGVTSEEDTKLYAADVAQWCANYYKGCLAEDPIGYTGDEYKDRDQYWMETVYKKINGRWVPFDGRRRVESGYMEPVTDKDSLDEPSIISGHPVVNTYINFVRKVSIRMYDPNGATESDRWLIPFVNDKIPLPWNDKTFKQNVEIQKKVLTLMKTNLRLVVVKQYT